MSDPSQDPAGYYGAVTAQYGRYAGAAQGWHYGLWEDDVRSHQQALLRSNEILLRDVPIDAATRVLDVGCGIGGFALWAAARHRCRVTGVTLVMEHARAAVKRAARDGLGDRCAFFVADMDQLAVRDRQFDVVSNQDTFCHAADKRGFVAAVHRVLRSGGLWTAIDFSIKDGPLDEREQRDLQTVRDGFHIPGLASASEVVAMLSEAGFDDIDHRDRTALVQRTSRDIIRRCYPPLLLMALHLDWLIFSRDADARAYRRGHVRAGLAYSRGLLAGYFRHAQYRARRP